MGSKIATALRARVKLLARRDFRRRRRSLCAGRPGARLRLGAATNFAAGTGPTSVAIGNLNGDANPDLAVANSGSDNVSILLGNGAGSFGAATNFATGSWPPLGRDRRPERRRQPRPRGRQLRFQQRLDPARKRRRLLRRGDRTSPPVRGPTAVAIGNLNGDAKPDLAVANDISAPATSRSCSATAPAPSARRRTSLPVAAPPRSRSAT